MPLLPDPITSQDLAGYLETTDDFQFEMDVFQICRNRGLTAQHAGMYTDPATGKMREFDIRARATRSLFNDGYCVLRFAIECKNLRLNYPLLVSCVPRRAEESYHCAILNPIKRSISGTALAGTDGNVRTSMATATRVTAETVKFGPSLGTIFRDDTAVGKSTVQVGKTLAQQNRTEKAGGTAKTSFSAEDKEVYEGVAQAVASCSDLVKLAATDYRTFDKAFAVTVIQPILVVADDTLWSIDYSSAGTRIGHPTQVKRCDLYLGRGMPMEGITTDYELSNLMIFTRTGFDEFLRDLNPYSTFSTGLWDSFFPDLSIRDLRAQLEAEAPFKWPGSL